MTTIGKQRNDALGNGILIGCGASILIYIFARSIAFNIEPYLIAAILAIIALVVGLVAELHKRRHANLH